jgi:hypothetical protein
MSEKHTSTSSSETPMKTGKAICTEDIIHNKSAWRRCRHWQYLPHVLYVQLTVSATRTVCTIDSICHTYCMYNWQYLPHILYAQLTVSATRTVCTIDSICHTYCMYNWQYLPHVLYVQLTVSATCTVCTIRDHGEKSKESAKSINPHPVNFNTATVTITYLIVNFMLHIAMWVMNQIVVIAILTAT